MANREGLDGTSRRTFLGATAGGLLAAQASTAAPVERFPWRVINLWHTPDRSFLWWTVNGNILTWEDMTNTRETSPLGRYVTQARQWGFNALSLASTVNPEKNPAALKNFGSYLKEHGLGLVLSRSWSESRRAGRANSGPDSYEMLCPYRAEVRAFWKQKINYDYEVVPTTVAHHVHAGARGGPWMCTCSECRKRTPRERTLDAIHFMSGLVAKHATMLFWDACQDDPWLMRLEHDLYHDLTGKVPANTLILADDHYWDFHPGWPIHSVLAAPPKDSQGKSPYATNIQSPGEYRGMHEFPWPMVDEWSETFRNMANTGQQAVFVTTEILPGTWDHPLNMVNWHAIQTYMRDPSADPGRIKLEWARERFGAKAAPAIASMLDKITEAGRGMYEFDALWTQKHSRFPWLEYLDCHTCGPYREAKREKGMMGLDLPLDMYPPRRAAEIKANPKTRLVFNRVPITRQLKSQAMAQKNGAVQLMEQAIQQWKGLAGGIPAADHQKIAAGLEANRADTIVFRNMMDLYMDWKLGVLTESKIDQVLAASRGLRGAIVPDPLATASSDNGAVITAGTLDQVRATLGGFAEQLRRDLRTPWLEAFWEKHPAGVS